MLVNVRMKHCPYFLKCPLESFDNFWGKSTWEVTTTRHGSLRYERG